MSHKKAQKAQRIVLIFFVPGVPFGGLISFSERPVLVSVPSVTTLRDRSRLSRARRYSRVHVAVLRKTRACECCRPASRTLPGPFLRQRTRTVFHKASRACSRHHAGSTNTCARWPNSKVRVQGSRVPPLQTPSTAVA